MLESALINLTIQTIKSELVIKTNFRLTNISRKIFAKPKATLFVGHNVTKVFILLSLSDHSLCLQSNFTGIKGYTYLHIIIVLNYIMSLQVGKAVNFKLPSLENEIALRF